MDRASATETIDSGSIPGRVTSKTTKIGNHNFPAWRSAIKKKGQYDVSIVSRRKLGRWQLNSKTANVPSLSPGQGNSMNKDGITLIIILEMANFLRRKYSFSLPNISFNILNIPFNIRISFSLPNISNKDGITLIIILEMANFLRRKYSFSLPNISFQWRWKNVRDVTPISKQLFTKMLVFSMTKRRFSNGSYKRFLRIKCGLRKVNH